MITKVTLVIIELRLSNKKVTSEIKEIILVITNMVYSNGNHFCDKRIYFI